MAQTVDVPIGAVITTLVVLALIGIAKVIVSAWPWARRAVHFMDRLEAIEASTVEIAADAKSANEAAKRAATAAEVAREQVLADSGASLRDAIDRLEATQSQILDRLDAVEARVTPSIPIPEGTTL